MDPDKKGYFDLPDDVCYLNGCSRSPLPKCVYDVGVAALAEKLRPWRVGSSAEAPGDLVRQRFLELVPGHQGSVALTPSTSFAMSAVAANLKKEATPETRIIILQDQMSSNVLPWQRNFDGRLSAVPYPIQDDDWTNGILTAMDALPRRSKSVVAVPHCHWVDGNKVDLDLVSRKCRDMDVSLVVDATQSLGAMPLGSLPRLDFLCASVHKWLCGPFGLAPLFVAEDRLDKLSPLLHDEHALQAYSDDSDVPFQMDLPGYDLTLPKTARALDAGGRPNPVLLPMVAEGLRFLLQELGGPENVASHCAALTTKTANRLSTGGYPYNIPPQHAPHILGLWPDDKSKTVESLAATLKKDHNVHVTGRFGALRVSFHSYNDATDVDRLLAALDS